MLESLNSGRRNLFPRRWVMALARARLPINFFPIPQGPNFDNNVRAKISRLFLSDLQVLLHLCEVVTNRWLAFG